MSPVTRGSVIDQVLQGAAHLHGDDAAAVAGRAARVGEWLYLLRVAASDLRRKLAVQPLLLRDRAHLREVLRSLGYRPHHDPQPAILPDRRDRDAGPVLGRARAELAVDGASVAAGDAHLGDELVVFEGGLVVAEDELFHRDLTLPPHAPCHDPRTEGREHR